MEENCDRKEKIVCLNCGTECDGKYCPNCGQSTLVGRLTAINLAQYCSAGLLRVNGTFFSTIGNLLIRPWKVISEFIAGKRVRYTPPFVLLVLLVFYDLLFSKWLNMLPVRDEKFVSEQSEMFQALDSILRFFYENETITALILILPLLLALRIAYRKADAARHNWVEYMFAGVFFLCLHYSAELVFLPLESLFGIDTSLNWLYSCMMGCIALWKTFPAGFWKSIRRLMLFFTLSFIFGLIYLGVIIAIIVVMAFVMSGGSLML